jgi:hypothetical protein
MKRSKLISIVLATLATAAIVAIGTYAWFVTQEDSSTVEIGTGNLSISVSDLQVDNNLNYILPGETFVMSTIDAESIKNNGSRNAVVKVDFYEKFEAKMENLTTDELTELAAFPDDYEINGSSAALKEKRLKEIFNFELDPASLADNGWVADADGYFYNLVEGNGFKSFGAINFKVEDELGGNVLDPNSGAISVSRPFEAKISVTFKYKAYAVQPSEAAVGDEFGAEAAALAKAEGWLDF